jgi:hypothetical protein
MKKKYICFKLLFLLIVFNCKIATYSNNKQIIKSLMTDGYSRNGNGSFQFGIGKYGRDGDSLEFEYEGKLRRTYLKSNKNKKKSFEDILFSNPTIKDTIAFLMSYEQQRTPYCKDTIDVYMNNQLVSSGEYPSNPQCRRYYRELPPHVKCTYVNQKKLKEASLLLVFHNEKIYFDTIIPLRFKKILIGHPGHGFWFQFGEPFD